MCRARPTSGDAVAIIESLNLGPAVLIGQSLGGHTALLVAAQHPDLVAAVVVAEASPDPDPDGPDRLRPWLSAWPAPFVSCAAASDYFEAMSYFKTRTAARVWAGGLEERSDGWWPRFDVDVMVDSLSEVAVTDYWDAWEAVRCRVLLVRGEHPGPLQRRRPRRRESRLVAPLARARPLPT